MMRGYRPLMRAPATLDSGCRRPREDGVDVEHSNPMFGEEGHVAVALLGDPDACRRYRLPPPVPSFSFRRSISSRTRCLQGLSGGAIHFQLETF